MNDSRYRSPLSVLAALTALSLLTLGQTGCATNPATGKSQIMLVSEAQEIAMGKQAHPEILAQMGVYDEPEIQEYVSALGQELAAKSERPHLEWHFTVVDDPLVNAFALPGGYIYITRGILAHFNSEAELAGVLGHEIGHVVARHSANQMSKQQLATIGLVVGSVLLEPEDRYLGNLAGAGMQLAFLKFGRDDERQADDLGLRYIDKVGYDPRPMANVFETLGRVGAAAGGAAGPNWFSTHPAPENRVARIQAGIAEIGGDFSGRPVRQEEYLAHLGGMPFGTNPREGYFRDNVFYHPDLAFQLTFPKGWKTQNTRSAVAAISPNEDAIVVMSLADGESLEGAETKFFQDTKATKGKRFRTGIRGLQSLGSYFQITSQGQQGGSSSKVLGRAAFVEQDDRIFRLLAYSPDGKFRGYDSTLGEATGSFQRLKDPKALNVQPARIELVRLDRDMSVQEFHRRYPSSVDAQTIAIMNGVDEGGTFERGRSVKRVVGGVEP